MPGMPRSRTAPPTMHAARKSKPRPKEQVTNNSLPYEETPHLSGIGERAFTVLILLMSTGAFMCLVTVTGQQPDEPGILGKLVTGSIYLIIFLLLSRCVDFWKTIWQVRWVIGLASFAVLSVFWSEDPSESFRKGISVFATALFGLYFASRYSLSDQIRLLARMCGISMVCSLVFGLLGLGQSVDGAMGWFGIYVQKNGLGRMALLSALVFWCLAKIDARVRWAAWTGVLLSLVLIYLSNSMTAMIGLALLIALQVWLRAFRRSKRLGVALLGLGAVVGVFALRWALMNMQIAGGAVGRDLSMTGRVQVWIFCTFMALQRPWLGYGYYAFWEGMKGPSARIWAALNNGVPHAHNGVIDLWLALGLVGVGIFAIGFITYLRRAFSCLDWTSPDSSWPLMYLAFFVIFNLTESSLLQPNSLFWALYAATAFSVSAQSESSPLRLTAGGHQIAYGR